VSRPVIKKFIDSKYHLPMDSAIASQLNRAIGHGTHTGNFVLPKGPSGKVKLTPKRVSETVKENKKPPARGATLKGARGSEIDISSPISSPAGEQPLKTIPATRKYTSMAKKARVAPSGRRVSTRKATAKRSGSKPTLTGSSAAIAKTRSATRAVKSKERASK